jgi:hypothetical protein
MAPPTQRAVENIISVFEVRKKEGRNRSKNKAGSWRKVFGGKRTALSTSRTLSYALRALRAGVPERPAE